MRWRRTLLFLATILLSEGTGIEIPARHHGLVSLFAVVIPLMLAGIWLVLVLQGRSMPPKVS